MAPSNQDDFDGYRKWLGNLSPLQRNACFRLLAAQRDATGVLGCQQDKSSRSVAVDGSPFERTLDLRFAGQ